MAIEKLPEDHFLIRELVESYVEDWKAKSGQRDHQKRGYFYMSDVSKCDRTIFYDFTCPENKRSISPKTLMTFAAGNLLHEDLQGRARKRGLIESGRDIEYGLEDWHTKATGRLDFIAAVYKFIETENGIAVTEVKTKNDYNFGEEEPNQEDIDQVLWYIDRLTESAAKSIKKQTVLPYGFVLYAARSMSANPLPLAAWKIDFDPERVAIIKARFTALDNAIIAGEIPQRPYERDSIKCQYCRYKEHCWQGVPESPVAVLVADESIEPPERELVESMAAHFIELQAEIKAKETEAKKCKIIFAQYFKAKGIKEIPINGDAIVYTPVTETSLDAPFLYSKLKEVWFDISIPQAKLIEAAIKAGKVDPELYERAKIIDYSWQIRIKKGKGGKDNANQKSL
jgi:CRISPR/Cas system-associated exonuclease Cas4 (RecB family)